MAISARRLQRANAPVFQGTSIGPNGHRISEMFGGDGNGSWANTPMPANTAIHPDSATAVTDIVYNVRQYATGTSVQAWPMLNYAAWTATLNVIDSSQYPLQPITLVGSKATDMSSLAVKDRAMFQEGFPLPPGLHPTDDTDGTIHLYDPDWKWPGRPNDPQYFGRIWELWGAKSPEQNAAAGQPAIWTARYAGRLTGVNNRLSAHPITRTWQADVTSQAMPSFAAVDLVTDPSGNTKYWGYGPDGVLELSTYMASASHIPMSHHILRISDMVNGVITHPMGFALYPLPASMSGDRAPAVWPATGWDGASRTWLPNGSRLRLPANYTATYPSGMPVSWRPMFDMFIRGFREYGIILVDMTGNSFGMRAEPGVQNYYPSGFSGKDFLQYLPWEDMQMLVVGNDSNFYPTA